VLLGFLQGAAVTRVRIEGIHHEFSVIPHVKEDTTELLLNVKALRLKPVSGQPGKLLLDVDGERRVTAADIRPSADFEIANPDLYLASLDSDEARLNIEFDVELSKGYREAESSGALAVGVIPVDAIFTPVRKVNFTVEPIHVGQETTHERLWLEVWTDGTVTPSEAVSRAAATLVDRLSPIANLSRVAPPAGEKEAVRPSIAPDLASMPVEQLNLSVRTLNCLRRGNINTVGELMSKSEKELMSLRNFGIKSKQELEERLESLGLSMPS
jgi:DNA-directed RNA polymerase subunit alpha